MFRKFITAGTIHFQKGISLTNRLCSRIPTRYASSSSSSSSSSATDSIFLQPFADKKSRPTAYHNRQTNINNNKKARLLFSKSAPNQTIEEDLSVEEDSTAPKPASTFDVGGKANDKEKDDVHSKRYSEIVQLEAEDSNVTMRNELYKFVFDNTMRSIKVNLDDVNVINIENEETFHRIPKLHHGLEAILRKPGIYPVDSFLSLQPDGGEFLRKIPSPDDIDFSRVPPYTPPSEDKLLLKFAKESKIKYVMSTSTIGNVLSQLFFAFSFFRNPNFSNISDNYDREPKKYMISQRKPVTNMLRKIDKVNNIWALDSDKGIFENETSVLLNIGKVLERSLTLQPEVFNEILLKSSKNHLNYKINDDHHRFMKLNNEICLRSQIDCYADHHITKQPFVFEIKTRSVCPIRYDLDNYKDYLDYRVVSHRGLHSSYEREYYDLIRGSFLKYAFQLKIGRMDGAFIAYHNTKEIFGFEYIKTKEIERRVFGNELNADANFVCCSRLLTILLDSVLQELKDESFEMLKFGFYSCATTKRMIVFTELFDESTTWEENAPMVATENIKDEFDYFTKKAKFTNRVYKFEFLIHVYINGVLQRYSGHELTKGDQIEIKYRFDKRGKASFTDYMNFLHEAYKMDTINLDVSYVGNWVK